MNEEEPKSFRTLRGFLAGEESDEETYFRYSATLRIFGEIPDLNEITVRLGIRPTCAYRRGEIRGPNMPPNKQDMWSFSPAVSEERALGAHIDALWECIKDHTDFLLELKRSVTVDVFLTYSSNNDCAGFEVPHTSLRMFSELQIPFGVSVVVC